MKGLEAKNIAADSEILVITRVLLRDIEDWLKPDAKPQEPYLSLLIDTIAAMSKGWRTCLEAAGDENVLTRWDDLTRESGLASRIYDTSSSLSFFFSCQAKQKIVSAMVSPEAVHPSPPHTVHLAHRMV